MPSQHSKYTHALKHKTKKLFQVNNLLDKKQTV